MLSQELVNETTEEVFCLAIAVEATVGAGDRRLGSTFGFFLEGLDDEGPGDGLAIPSLSALYSPVPSKRNRTIALWAAS